MEMAGFVCILDRIMSNGIKIDQISTDRHVQIRKLLRVEPKYQSIEHRIDPWHLIKGMKKKLNAKARKKGCEIIGITLREEILARKLFG